MLSSKHTFMKTNWLNISQFDQLFLSVFLLPSSVCFPPPNCKKIDLLCIAKYRNATKYTLFYYVFFFFFFFFFRITGFALQHFNVLKVYVTSKYKHSIAQLFSFRFKTTFPSIHLPHPLLVGSLLLSIFSSAVFE